MAARQNENRRAKRREPLEPDRASGLETRDHATAQALSRSLARERELGRKGPQAEAATRIVQDRYDNGLTTITEVLRAQAALVGARLGLLASRYRTITGYAELLRSTGGLLEIDPFL